MPVSVGLLLQKWSKGGPLSHLRAKKASSLLSFWHQEIWGKQYPQWLSRCFQRCWRHCTSLTARGLPLTLTNSPNQGSVFHCALLVRTEMSCHCKGSRESQSRKFQWAWPRWFKNKNKPWKKSVTVTRQRGGGLGSCKGRPLSSNLGLEATALVVFQNLLLNDWHMFTHNSLIGLTLLLSPQVFWMKKLRHKRLSKLLKVIQLVRSRMRLKPRQLGSIPTDLTAEPHTQPWLYESSEE